MSDDEVILFSDDYSTASSSDDDISKTFENIPIKEEPISEVSYLDQLRRENESVLEKLLEDFYEGLNGNPSLTQEEKISLQNKRVELENEIYSEKRRQKFNESLLLPPPSDDHIQNAMSPPSSDKYSLNIDDRRPVRTELPQSFFELPKLTEAQKNNMRLIVMQGAKGIGLRKDKRGAIPSAEWSSIDRETQACLMRIHHLDRTGDMTARLRRITYNAPYSIRFVPKTTRRRGVYSSKKTRQQAMKAKDNPKRQRSE
jgi:hypothetical protein